MTAEQAHIVVDLGFGDAGKGSIVDYLVRQHRPSVVVRYNGGPQAAHNVITPDGRHHTFAQFGSGSFVPGVQTHLSKHMLINPFNAFQEANNLLHLGVNDIWLKTTFDIDAMVITPFHVAMNRLREMSRNEGKHGSCGQGIGETRSFEIRNPETAVRVKDLDLPKALHKKLEYIQTTLREDSSKLRVPTVESCEWAESLSLLTDPSKVDQIVTGYGQFTEVAKFGDTDDLAQAAKTHGTLVFEGAQGVLLDERFGFHPYTTWSNITPGNAVSLLADIGFDGHIEKYGLLRGYATRHGAGPFVTENTSLTDLIPDMHNGNNRWQDNFRVGFPDMVAARYALSVIGGVDQIVVSNLDRMTSISKWSVAEGYRVPKSTETLFELDDSGIARNILHDPMLDLNHQEQITNALLGTEPIYRTVPTSGNGEHKRQRDFDDLLAVFQDQLGAPVKLTSFGPTAESKFRVDLDVK